jgi:hypothetical protein
MPPRSYFAIAVALAVLVAISVPLSSGASLVVWPWLFAASATILGIVGAFRAVDALSAPRWIAPAFALPGFMWAIGAVKSLNNVEPPRLIDFVMIGTSTQIAFLAAAAGALRLIEAISAPHAWLRFGYAILIAHAVVVCVEPAAEFSGWHFARSAPYAASALALRAAATFVEYAAIIRAALLLTKQRGIEPWTSIAISLIGCAMLYSALQLMFETGIRPIPNPWVQSVAVFVGGAAVWRMGALLSARVDSSRQDRFGGTA